MQWNDGLECGETDWPSQVTAASSRRAARSTTPKPWLIRHPETSVLALPGRYCRVYVVAVGRSAAVVDIGSCEDIPLVLQGLAHLGVKPSEVAFVTATHLHFDHAMGLDQAAKQLGTTVALGRGSRDAVDSGTPVPWPRELGTLRAIPGWVMQGMPSIAKSDRAHGMDFGFPWSKNRFAAPLGPVLNDGLELPGLPGWNVLATPGHSPDSICLHHERAGILVAGDCMRNFRGGEWNRLLHDVPSYERTRQRLLRLDVRVACPGHGAVLAGDGVIGTLRSIGLFGMAKE